MQRMRNRRTFETDLRNRVQCRHCRSFNFIAVLPAMRMQDYIRMCYHLSPPVNVFMHGYICLQQMIGTIDGPRMDQSDGKPMNINGDQNAAHR
jgi:hypothetical protein